MRLQQHWVVSWLKFQRKNDFNKQIPLQRGIKMSQQQKHDENYTDLYFQDAIFFERNAEIQEIQKEMQEVNLLFKDMANLINQQGDLVDSIQDHIQHSSQNVRDGNDSLIKAENEADKSNTLTCWIAGIVASTVGVGTAITTALILL